MAKRFHFAKIRFFKSSGSVLKGRSTFGEDFLKVKQYIFQFVCLFQLDLGEYRGIRELLGKRTKFISDC